MGGTLTEQGLKIAVAKTVDRLQSVAVAVQSFLGDFGATVQVRQAAAHAAPLRLAFGFIVLWPIHRKQQGIGDSDLRPRYRPRFVIRLVVELDGIGAWPVV